jgi:cobalt-precorrin 5A hydrolase
VPSVNGSEQSKPQGEAGVGPASRAASQPAGRLRGATLVLGLGCERGTPPKDVIALAERALVEAGATMADLLLVTSLDARADESAILATARHFGVSAAFYDAATLEAEASRLENPSKVVFAHTGCHGVAEGAALVGAGRDAVLVVPKITSSQATAAIAGPASMAAGRRSLSERR